MANHLSTMSTVLPEWLNVSQLAKKLPYFIELEVASNLPVPLWLDVQNFTSYSE